MDTVLIIAGVVALALMTQRWFWLLAFGAGALASWFAVLASIFHFEILGALGFFVLASILTAITNAIAEGA